MLQKKFTKLRKKVTWCPYVLMHGEQTAVDIQQDPDPDLTTSLRLCDQ